MSKILEALRRRPRPPAPATHPEEREIQVEPTGREWTQEQLANVYFTAVGKPKSSEPPVIIKVVEKRRLAAFMPWLITSVAFFITAAALFSTKRLLIDVRILDDKALLVSSEEDAPAAPLDGRNRGIPGSAPLDTAEKSESFPLESFSFEGGALLQSSKDARRLTLVNSSVAPFARAILRPGRPIDMSQAKLTFEARGARGGENLAVALKDRGNVHAFKKGLLRPFPSGLSTEWTSAEVVLVDLNENFDPKNVTGFRFEFGSKDTANRSGDTIYIRNLRLAPLA